MPRTDFLDCTTSPSGIVAAERTIWIGKNRIEGKELSGEGATS